MPVDPGVLSPEAWLQAGAIGVLALTVILITISFLWYIGRRDQQMIVRDRQWQVHLSASNHQFEQFLKSQTDQRKESMKVGLREIDKVSVSIAHLAKAMGTHDVNAVRRTAAVMKAVGEIKQTLDKTETVN